MDHRSSYIPFTAMFTFTTHRAEPELVAPARSTPHDSKTLSDLDDHPGHMTYVSIVEFFRPIMGHMPEDMAETIKVALAEALVYYYPMAGRMQATPHGKLVIHCTGEGVAFVKANADVQLEELGQPLIPPYPCVGELLCDAGNTQVMVDKPIIFLQMTRFRCGGIVLGFHISHCIADGFGMIQFIKAIVDLARGEVRPMVLPVWERELLMAREPPNIAYFYPKYKPFFLPKPNQSDMMLSAPPDTGRMASHYFIFGSKEISFLRSNLPEGLAGACTNFELLCAVMWRCRTVALGYEASERVHFVFSANARRKGDQCSLQMPEGYYGNALIYQIVEVTVEELCNNPLGHTVELIREAKSDMSEEHMRSEIDLLSLLRGGPPPPLDKVYLVTDATSLGEDKLDLGWAEWIGGGGAAPTPVTCLQKCRSSDGNGAIIAVSMMLPEPAMERLKAEIKIWLNQK